MKTTTTLFSLFVFLLFPYLSSAQVWIEQNATWHYDYWNIGSGGFYEMNYSQDTLVGGNLCQQIDRKKYAFTTDQFGNIIFWDSLTLPPQFTYVEGDTVFYWNDNQFFTLFNFGASIGDQWQIGSVNPQSLAACSDSSFVEVVDTGSMVINSLIYRTITLATVDSSAIGLQGTFVERFGFIDANLPFHLFPRTMNCTGDIIEYDIVTFKCFEDDSLSLYNPSGEDCEYYLTHLDVDERSLSDATIQPNPFNDHVQISHLYDGRLTVYDLQGSKVVSLPYSTHQSIDFSHLKRGIYLMVIEDELGSIMRMRVLKH